MKSIILIATHKRNKLLQLNLQTLIPQLTPDTTCIVLDDSYIADKECYELTQQFNCQYLHTGKTKEKDDWRMPGYAFNIGVRQNPCDVVILCCAEIYHLNNTITFLLQSINDTSITIPEGKWDWEQHFTRAAISKQTNKLEQLYTNISHILKVELPFLMAIPYLKYVEIGGYDEDFIGATYDDDDFVDRLKLAGCTHVRTPGQIVHMFDSPISQQHSRPNAQALKEYNQKLYKQRKGLKTRNIGKEWGKYDT